MPSQDKVGEILSRFPGPITLYPSRKKWLVMLLISAAFAAVGLWMVMSGDARGWFVLAFFGTGSAVAAIVLLPAASFLKFDRESFEIVHLFRRFSVLWKDATGFEAATIPPSREKLVVFDDFNARHGAIARLNVGLIGRNGALPDTYGLSAEELAELMVQWRERAIRNA